MNSQEDQIKVLFEILQDDLPCLFLCFTCFQRSSSRLRRIMSGYLRAILFFCSPFHAATKWETPVEAANIWVGILFLPLHNLHKYSWRYVTICTKIKFELNTILSVVFLFLRPPSCPYKMTGFLPNTYWMGGSRFFFLGGCVSFQIYHLRAKTLKTVWVLEADRVVPPPKNAHNNMISR